MGGMPGTAARPVVARPPVRAPGVPYPRGTIKWRGTGRQPWLAPITLTVRGNGMSPDGWVRLP
jgi:hypothetical protein